MIDTSKDLDICKVKDNNRTTVDYTLNEKLCASLDKIKQLIDENKDCLTGASITIDCDTSKYNLVHADVLLKIVY